MRKLYRPLLLLLLLLPGLTGCDKSTPSAPTDEQITITMPKTDGQVSTVGLESGIRYYLYEGLTVDVTLTQGAQTTISLEGLPITDISADSSTGKVTLSAKQLSKLRQGEPYDLTLQLRSEKDHRAVAVSKREEKLPYDLLGHLPIEMEGKTSVDGGEDPQVELAPQGVLFTLKLGNKTTGTIRLQKVALSGDEATFPDSTLLPPQEQTKVLALLDKAPAEQSSLTINDVKADAEISTTGTSSKQPVAVFTKAGLITSNAEKLLPKDKANTINGGDPDFAFSDITFWVGQGSNISAFVLDFHDDALKGALVWGYRWDEAEGKNTTTADMIFDILKEDPRLYTLIGNAFGGFTAFGGFGYLLGDLKGRERAQVTFDGTPLREQSERVFFADDLKFFDSSVLSDPQSVWICGWHFDSPGYWSFFTRFNRLKPWTYSNVMADNDRLRDGSWSCFSYQQGWESYTGAKPGRKFISAVREE